MQQLKPEHTSSSSTFEGFVLVIQKLPTRNSKKCLVNFMARCLFMILFYIIIKAQWSSRREAHWLASCNCNEALELEVFP